MKHASKRGISSVAMTAPLMLNEKTVNDRRNELLARVIRIENEISIKHHFRPLTVLFACG
jgi:hypothetical protein